jgi:hypothetical protein
VTTEAYGRFLPFIGSLLFQLPLRLPWLPGVLKSLWEAIVRARMNGWMWWLYRPTWLAPCDDVETPGKEWVKFHVVQGSHDRLMSVCAPLSRPGNAMRVHVLNDDEAWDPVAQKPVKSGWRAEAIAIPQESASLLPTRYSWATHFPSDYPGNPRNSNGERIWQVFAQWHHGGEGGSPPIAFIVRADQVALELRREDGSAVFQGPAHPNEVHEIAPLAAGTKWHEFQIEIYWHSLDGWIRLHYDGKPFVFTLSDGSPALELTGLQTLFPATPTAYFKLGLYRQADPPTGSPDFILFHDDASREIGIAVGFTRIPHL